MSTTQFRRFFQDALLLLKSRPLYWILLGIAQLSLLWSQDIIPYLGTIAASILSVWLMASAYDEKWTRKSRPLFGLGFLFFPLAALWAVLSSLAANSGLIQVLSTAWSVPILFFMAIAYLTLNQSIARILIEEKGVDKALAESWKNVTTGWRSYFTLAGFFTLIWMFSLMTGGYGFVIAAPLTVALFRATEKSIAQA